MRNDFGWPDLRNKGNGVQGPCRERGNYVLLCEGSCLVVQMWLDARRPHTLCSLGIIWEYWRDVSRPSGRGIELPVEEISGEVESENLCKATLIGPGKVFFPVRKMRCCTWVIVTNVIPYSEAFGKDCFFISWALRQFLSQTHPRCCPLTDAVSLLHQQKPDLPLGCILAPYSLCQSNGPQYLLCDHCLIKGLILNYPIQTLPVIPVDFDHYWVNFKHVSSLLWSYLIGFLLIWLNRALPKENTFLGIDWTQLIGGKL